MSPSKTPAVAPVAHDPGAPAPHATPAASAATGPYSTATLRWLSDLHERERRDVAAVLHNQIGQAVSAIKMSAYLILDETDPVQRREDLLDIIRIADATVAQLRGLHCQLRPPQLDALGLEAALRGEVERLAGAVDEVDLDLAPLRSRPDPEVELACLRIAQQLLTHVPGRAGMPMRTSRLRVMLQDHGKSLSLRIEFDAGQHQVVNEVHMSELASLAEYAAVMGGTLRADAAGGSCLAVELRFPFNNDTSTAADDGLGHASSSGSRGA